MGLQCGFTGQRCGIKQNHRLRLHDDACTIDTTAGDATVGVRVVGCASILVVLGVDDAMVDCGRSPTWFRVSGPTYLEFSGERYSDSILATRQCSCKSLQIAVSSSSFCT